MQDLLCALKCVKIFPGSNSLENVIRKLDIVSSRVFCLSLITSKHRFFHGPLSLIYYCFFRIVFSYSFSSRVFFFSYIINILSIFTICMSFSTNFHGLFFSSALYLFHSFPNLFLQFPCFLHNIFVYQFCLSLSFWSIFIFIIQFYISIPPDAAPSSQVSDIISTYFFLPVNSSALIFLAISLYFFSICFLLQ